jgi:hypothetical protein
MCRLGESETALLPTAGHTITSPPLLLLLILGAPLLEQCWHCVDKCGDVAGPKRLSTLRTPACLCVGSV